MMACVFQGQWESLYVLASVCPQTQSMCDRGGPMCRNGQTCPEHSKVHHTEAATASGLHCVAQTHVLLT